MSSLRYFVLFLGLLVASCGYTSAVAPGGKKALKDAVIAQIIVCATELEATEDDILQAKKKRNYDDCLLNCILEKLGIMKDGKFDVTASDALVQNFFDSEKDKETANKLVLECRKVNDEVIEGDNKGCKRARLLLECVDEKNKVNSSFYQLSVPMAAC